MVVRDDAMVLYGFANADERELFDLLVTVNGIGPKVALVPVGHDLPDALRRAVSSGDVAALTSSPGSARRSRSGGARPEGQARREEIVIVDGPLADVREALLALGLSPQEASDAMTVSRERRPLRRGPAPGGAAAGGRGQEAGRG